MTVFEGEKGLVSIGIVTWNSAKDLPSCIGGLQAQDYPQIEYIVVDNGSLDGRELLRYKSRWKLERLYVSLGNFRHLVVR